MSNIKKWKYLPLLLLAISFSTCTLPWEDEHGLQKIRFYLAIVNHRSDSLSVSQSPLREMPRYSTSRINYDTTFSIQSNQTIIDSIDYEFVTIRGTSSSKDMYHLSNTPDVVEDMTMNLSISSFDTVKQISVFPWDTTVSADWYGPWNELGKMYDTLVID